MKGTDFMSRIGDAQEEARKAKRHAFWKGRWPDDLSKDAADILARDPEAVKMNARMARTDGWQKKVEEKAEKLAEHDWRTADTAWGRVNRRFAGMFGKKEKVE